MRMTCYHQMKNLILNLMTNVSFLPDNGFSIVSSSVDNSFEVMDKVQIFQSIVR